MNKKLILLFACVCACVSSALAQREVGLHFGANAGYVISATKIEAGSFEAKFSNRICAEFIGGYQITPNVFAGVGVGGQYFHDGKGWEIPVFADLRYDFCLGSGKISPFVDAQVGYSFADWEGLYVNPQVGMRFGIGNGLGLNLSAGYLLQTFKGADGTSGDITVKIGVDF